MRATGIVRRIDDLGRIVIPKELRKTLRFKEGETLEIFTSDDGSVTLKKYSAFHNIGEHAQIYAESLSGASDFTVLVTDTQSIVAAAYQGNRITFGSAPLSELFYNKILTRKIFDADKYEQNIPVTGELDPPAGLLQSIAPIISMGNVAGAVVVFYHPDNIKCARQSARAAAAFFNKLIDN